SGRPARGRCAAAARRRSERCPHDPIPTAFAAIVLTFDTSPISFPADECHRMVAGPHRGAGCVAVYRRHPDCRSGPRCALLTRAYPGGLPLQLLLRERRATARRDRPCGAGGGTRRAPGPAAYRDIADIKISGWSGKIGATRAVPRA